MGNTIMSPVISPGPLQPANVFYMAFTGGLVSDSPATVFCIMTAIQLFITYVLGTFTYTLAEIQVWSFFFMTLLAIASGWLLQDAWKAPPFFGWSVIDARAQYAASNVSGSTDKYTKNDFLWAYGFLSFVLFLLPVVAYEAIPNDWAAWIVAAVVGVIVYFIVWSLIKRTDAIRTGKASTSGTKVQMVKQSTAFNAMMTWGWVWTVGIYVAFGIHRSIPNTFWWYWIGLIVAVAIHAFFLIVLIWMNFQDKDKNEASQSLLTSKA